MVKEKEKKKNISFLCVSKRSGWKENAVKTLFCNSLEQPVWQSGSKPDQDRTYPTTCFLDQIWNRVETKPKSHCIPPPFFPSWNTQWEATCKIHQWFCSWKMIPFFFYSLKWLRAIAIAIRRFDWASSQVGYAPCENGISGKLSLILKACKMSLPHVPELHNWRCHMSPSSGQLWN